ncbi:F-box only protein 10-like isoform X2 [Haliotis rubra]|uniref:F-box only protein 10-like isoform X2 n=1 Tax=Haliotis rubra TaxID=36100 RepID=UPI001EE540DC|nr:F-box only protein 10-like isoform X2 [Haliotis rubra]
MSTTTVKTDTMSKVLPGDKSGLPWEIWQMILSYLNAADLCRGCCVSKTWNDLILSLDGSRWKELYLKCEDWKHPFWPLNIHSEPPSWKQAYHDQYLSTRQWSQCSRDLSHSSCLYVLKRKKDRKIIRVGRGKEHSSLKSALSVANDFDRIEVYPGIYDEQFEMTSKIPFELVGVGELGSVILVVCIEQIALTGRLSNLVLRAPWFTTFILKIRAGYLQLDNCILEDGMVYAQNPGTCHIRFCTFRHATIILQHMNVSVIENCEFSQSDTADIIVEGYSKDERNWTYSYLRSRMNSIFSQNRRQRRQSLITMKTTESHASTMHSMTASSAHLANHSSDSASHDHNDQSGTSYCDSLEPSQNIPNPMLVSNGVADQPPADLPETTDNQNSSNTQGSVSHQHESISNSNDSNANLQATSESVMQEPVQNQNEAACIHVEAAVNENEARVDENEAQGGADNAEAAAIQVPHLDLNEGNFENQPRPDSGQSLHSRLSFDSEDSLSFLDDLDSARSSSPDVGRPGSISSSSDDDEDIERIVHTDSDDDLSSGEESVIMLPHLRQKHIQASISAQGVNADIVSISSQTSQPIPTDVIQDSLMRSVVDQVQGCLIHQCRMIHSKGGVMVSLQAHAIVSECDICNVGYGIRCIQNSRVVVLKNKIHHCRTSGIFMRLAASGLIAGNDIHSNMEAVIDIRKNADPIVQNNRIHHGKRSGVVVLGSGRGQVKKNDIYENREAGVYILYGGNPTVCQNHIYDGKAAGVAVNENGCGFIFDNVIRGNQWGGVDIRHGGDPVVSGNTISHGIGDGIVIGERGRGSLENNVISGNAGCGIWIMSASQPFLHGNQINNNGDSGIMFVNKSDVQHVPNVPDGMNIASSRSLGYGDGEEGPPRPRCDVATVQYNNVYHNSGKGIVIQMEDAVHVHFNAVYANLSDGITVNQDSAVVLKSNSITNNCGTGIVSASPSSENQSIHIHGNGVYDNRDHGIVCRCCSHISQNDVVGNLNGAISLDGNALVTVVENRLQCPHGPCMKVVGVTQGVVENNTVYEGNKETWIRHDAFSERLILANNVQRPGTESKSTFNKTEFLRSPAPRPVIDPPPPPSVIPAHNISSITKVTVPSGEGCEQGSKLCVIL